MLLLHLLLSCRYMLNWVKIRVWEQVQWDAVIMIDVDVTVLGDLTHLFKLPTDFAAVPDNGKVWNRYICTLDTSTSMKYPESPLHMHCKLGLHTCSQLLLSQLLHVPFHSWEVFFGRANDGWEGEGCVKFGQAMKTFGVCTA